MLRNPTNVKIDRMTILSALLLPLLITGLPLILIWALNKVGFIKGSFELTLIAMVISVAIGFATPLYAVMTCAQGLSQSLPADQPKCLTGAAMFFPSGILMTIMTFILGIYYCVSAYRSSYGHTKTADFK